jgi:hypothetical protein
VVSQHAIVLCGEYFIKAIGHAYELVVPACWDNTKRWQDTDAARIAPLYHGSNATFLKDKIHTLCKLANDSRADALAVELDYKVKDAELYRELALKILNRNQCLDVLSVPRAPEASALGTLPSWIPDWGVADFTALLRMPTPSGMALLEFQATPKALCVEPFQ